MEPLFEYVQRCACPVSPVLIVLTNELFRFACLSFLFPTRLIPRYLGSASKLLMPVSEMSNLQGETVLHLAAAGEFLDVSLSLQNALLQQLCFLLLDRSRTLR